MVRRSECACVHSELDKGRVASIEGEAALLFENRMMTDDTFSTEEMGTINSALSDKIDVSGALKLDVNKKPKRVFQGIMPGHEGFVVGATDTHNLVKRNRRNSEILKPYMIGDDLLGEPMGRASRYIIDFDSMDIVEVQNYPDLRQYRL